MTALEFKESKVAVVQLGDFTAKHYDFKTDLDLERGDIVVCDTRNGLVLGTVMSTKVVSAAANKWVVCKVDITAHKERLQREEDAARIKRELDKRVKKLQEVQLYKMLAEEDEEMKGLLEQYQQLTS